MFQAGADVTSSDGEKRAAHMARSVHLIAALGAALLVSTSFVTPADASLLRRAKAKHSESREAGKREKKEAKYPSGVLHIVVNISTQRVALYSDDKLATRSTVSTGVPGHPTPLGVFSVIGKERYHASNIYSGAPMPFMQRITWSGVALHQGFVTGRPASHGCIRLTSDFAQLLWQTTKIGARVIIAREDVAPSMISNPRLFVPRPAAEAAATAPTRTAEATPVTTSDAAAPAAVKANETPELRPTMAAEPDKGADPALSTPPVIPAVTVELDKVEGRKELAPPRGPISIFISGKERRLFVRQAFLPIFDAPVAISDADRPLGTHVYTAFADESDATKLRWLTISVPDPQKTERRAPARGAKEAKNEDKAPSASTAAEALDRLDIPADARQRVDEMVTAGASLIVSDHGLGDETGEGTDFIVVTR